MTDNSKVADQQSSMFGQCRFEPGDLKCTLGTGTFVDCNTGEVPHTSMHGALLFKLVNAILFKLNLKNILCRTLSTGWVEGRM